MIIPSLDLMSGRAVQLQQGTRKVLEREDVRELAERFGRVGTLAVVDLDAALGLGENRNLVRELCRLVPCRVGGGLRDADTALDALRTGAEEIVVGTAATPALLARLPRERTIVSLDARDGRVVTQGWTVTHDESPLERASRLATYCAGFLFTSVEREGLLGGPDLATAYALREASSGFLTVAGGIASVDDVVLLDRAGIDAQVGMALYTGALDEVEAFVASINFERMDGMVPTIVLDAANGGLRMLAYSTKESLTKALREGGGLYWSRTRNALWRKGDTSGHSQRLIRARVDCDRDALVFHVEQTGPTCHRGIDRCFEKAPFTWETLMARIRDRAARGSRGDSYTRKLLLDPALLESKLIEESQEVAEACTSYDVGWECADLLYFMSAKMQAASVSIPDVMAQLMARAK